MAKEWEYLVVEVTEHTGAANLTKILNDHSNVGWKLHSCEKISHKHNGSFGDHWEFIFERKVPKQKKK